MTHWAQNDFRSDTLKKSLDSAIETTKHLQIEFILFDNGSSKEDSDYLLNLCHEGKISFYTRSSNNLYFGFGRNRGVDLACGDILVFSDNDIEYSPGWLDKCIKILKAFPDKKIAVTPLKTDRQHRQEKYWKEWFEVNGERFPANNKAGSNSWVMRRKDFDEVGKFRNHHIAGSHWTDKFVNTGYTMVTMETNPLAQDLAFKQGYAIKVKADIRRKFANGEELSIND